MAFDPPMIASRSRASSHSPKISTFSRASLRCCSMKMAKHQQRHHSSRRNLSLWTISIMWWMRWCARNLLASAFDLVRSILGNISDEEKHVTLGDLPALAQRQNTVIGYEAWANHGEWIRREKPKFSDLIGGRFEGASKVTAEAVQEAYEHMARHRDRMQKILLENNGIIVMPTAPGIAYPREAPPSETDNYRFRTLQMCSIAGMAGLPQVTLRLITINDSSNNNKFAVGVSLVGPRNSDKSLLKLSRQVEAEWRNRAQQQQAITCT
eukprot:GEZU01015774.1.p1 GENE.GEZU01015774.1~~GEZU01015774.1.p1  ORF type:complete len:267 (-),score=49.44 GEZU01015774.1:22-822(-)